MLFKNEEIDALKVIFDSCQHLEGIDVRCGGKWLKEQELLDAIITNSPGNFCELIIYNVKPSKLLLIDFESFFFKLGNPLTVKTIKFNR